MVTLDPVELPEDRLECISSKTARPMGGRLAGGVPAAAGALRPGLRAVFAFAMLACARLGYNRLPCVAEAHARSPDRGSGWRPTVRLVGVGGMPQATARLTSHSVAPRTAESSVVLVPPKL
jgi:hypothetical protein